MYTCMYACIPYSYIAKASMHVIGYDASYNHDIAIVCMLIR